MHKFCKAFTLAEVLITIGIIGIVAAMTLPTLINNTQNQELQTQLKKTYSELNQFARLYYNDHGISVAENAASSQNWKDFIAEFPKYMKGVTLIDDWNYSDIDPDTGLNSTTMPYKIYSIKGVENRMVCDNAGFRSDVIGRIYAFNDPPAAGENGPVICVDINGEKKPNKYGIDIFLFSFTTDGFVIPMGQKHKNNPANTNNGVNFFTTDCKVDQSYAWQLGCAAYALSDTNPAGDGNYWHDFLKSAK